ncbi:DNA-processing protein DprA [Sediminibacterium soli]|uniref:DNA-processing protein DprA n=1 Tax=Sediminibacterium soli TaxID=2698829 RepID=UPI00137977D8|nr:DNA-processing protein DprA [Sediminibacterium soli]NCI47276.1 DNA-protecting protein DprA [Sediminibacterium soli]
METELFYRIALTMIPELGAVCNRCLVERFGDAMSVFTAKKKEIGAVEGIGEQRARSLKEWKGFAQAEAELRFLEKHQIQPLFLTDTAYPKRLLHCYDPPTLLYYRGNADLNQPKVISIIGTRNHTEYGKRITQELIAALKAHSVLVVSGLAFGIDAIAHKTCLQENLPTIGVLAHGLDTLYPLHHKQLAKEMVTQGGLLTEFPQRTRPDKHNFPRRNRIVAGMSDATIVIETAIKGGSMITAELAHTYHRDVFAVPGRIGDQKSGGCLKLVQQNQAILFSDAQHLIETMGWLDKKPTRRNPQKQLFPELTKEEQAIADILQQGPLPIDELCFKTGLSTSAAAAAILTLELQNIVCALPGKMYQLV